ncbi:PfkB family carbohydrate kinase [Bacteroidota bacterium]
MNKTIYDILIIGNYTKDTIVTPSGTRYVDGGGFNYGAHVAAMMGLKVAAMTRLAEEDKHVVENLKNIGVDVFPFYSPKSTLLQLFYPTSNVDERNLTVKSVADPFLPEHMNGVDAKIFLLNASTRGEISLKVIKELKKKNAMIVADLQGYIRVIAPEGTLHYIEWPEKKEVLSRVDILKSDAVEGEFLTGEKDIRVQAKMLSELGPSEIVLTHRNGILVFAGGKYYEAPFSYGKLVGRSGRGDTCISSYVCKRISSSPEESIIWSAAVTSLKMEAEGPIKREMSEVEAHIRRHYN